MKVVVISVKLYMYTSRMGSSNVYMKHINGTGCRADSLHHISTVNAVKTQHTRCKLLSLVCVLGEQSAVTGDRAAMCSAVQVD